MGDPMMIIILVLTSILAAVLGAIGITLYRYGNADQLDANSQKASKGSAGQKIDYPKEDIQKFMEFEKIEDDMIVQEKVIDLLWQ